MISERGVTLPPLFIIQKGGVTPQNEIRWRNQITWIVVLISHYDFEMGCDPLPLHLMGSDQSDYLGPAI